jgi:hypothetical protein
VLHELEEEEKVEGLRWHSEKLAITFGLLRTVGTTMVRVFKNIRMCNMTATMPLSSSPK